MKPAVNNEIYNDLAKEWWNPNSFLNILETGIQPLRANYIRQSLGPDFSPELHCLDIGCGGGIITEDLAKLSNNVSGIDLSQASLNTAKEHAKKAGLSINYLQAAAENLPFDDSSFDLVTCCDVLEHVDDLPQVIKEINRVLKPGGTFVFDTINRTLMSFLSVIWVAQDFPPTRFAPKNTHVWHKFIKPSEMRNHLLDNKLRVKDICGMGPSKNPLMMLWYIFRVKQKKIDFANFGSITKFKLMRSKSISYIGHCTKPLP